MKAHHRPIVEWVGIAAVAVVAFVAYILYTGTQLAVTMGGLTVPGEILAQTMTNIVLLMIFSALIVLIIVEVRNNHKLERLEMAILGELKREEEMLKRRKGVME